MPKKTGPLAKSSTAQRLKRARSLRGVIKYNKISHVYTYLHESPKWLSIYHDDKNLFVRKAKLSPVHKQIILGGNSNEIKKAIEVETRKPMAGFSWIF